MTETLSGDRLADLFDAAAMYAERDANLFAGRRFHSAASTLEGIIWLMLWETLPHEPGYVFACGSAAGDILRALDRRGISQSLGDEREAADELRLIAGLLRVPMAWLKAAA